MKNSIKEPLLISSDQTQKIKRGYWYDEEKELQEVVKQQKTRKKVKPIFVPKKNDKDVFSSQELEHQDKIQKHECLLPPYFLNQKIRLHRVKVKFQQKLDLKEIENELKLKNTIETKEIYENQQNLPINYPSKEVQKSVKDYNGKIPDLNKAQIISYLENIKQVQFKHKHFELCVTHFGFVKMFAHSTSNVLIYQNQMRLVTIGLLIDDTIDAFECKLYLLIHNINLNSNSMISNPIFKVVLSSFIENKQIDTRCKFYQQVGDHLYFYTVETSVEQDYFQTIKLNKVCFLHQMANSEEVIGFDFQYKLDNFNETKKHNIINNVLFRNTISGQFDEEASLEPQQAILIIFDAKLDRVGSEKGVAYGFSRIQDRGELLKINDEKYFYEIKNQVDSKGDDIMNFVFLGVDQDSVYLITNELENKKLQIKSKEMIQEIDIEKENQTLTSILKSIQFQNQRILKIHSNDDNSYKSETFNWE